MASSRLTDSQKSELVRRYRQGESSAALAAAFGCSPNTVSRTVKAALDPADYKLLKRQRSRGVLPEVTGTPGPVSQPQADHQPDLDLEPDLGFDPALEPVAVFAVSTEDSRENVATINEDICSEKEGLDDTNTQSSILALEDADDFGADDAESDDDGDANEDIFTPVAVLPLGMHHEPVAVQPLASASLPESLYMLVDKTVELQARPLREITELGQLPPDEEELQALLLFANPRQAKRHCGRTQRVIKMPDPDMFMRCASYLQIKGITRLVVEGSLYALPGC